MAITAHSAFLTMATHTRLIQDLTEAIKNKVFYENLEDFFRIQPGIKGGQQVVALDPLEYVTKKETACGAPIDSFAVAGVSQLWEPQLASVKIKMCYSEFTAAFTRWGLANGYNIHDLSEANFFSFIQDMVVDAMKADMLRLVLLGDTYTEGVDTINDKDKIVYYNVIPKGLIPTLTYIKTVYPGQFVTILKNALTTRTLQMGLAADDALNIFEALTDNQYFESDQILTSNSLYKNYKNFLRRGSGMQYLESSKDQIQSGMESLRFDGEIIKPIKMYDKKILEDFTTHYDAVGADPGPEADAYDISYLPHFAVNTNKENLVVGVDDLNALSDLTLEYVGGSDEHFYIKGNYMIDFKIPNPKALRAAL